MDGILNCPTLTEIESGLWRIRSPDGVLMLRPTLLFRGMSKARLLAAHRTRLVSSHLMSTAASEVSLPSP